MADPDAKKAAVWTSSITAAGVGGQQASKFLKLMGIKKAPTSITNVSRAYSLKIPDPIEQVADTVISLAYIVKATIHSII